MADYVDVSTGPLHQKNYGGSGPPIVLVHGLGGSFANWDVIGPKLAAQGHVTAIDLPGFGLSPPANDWELTTHQAAIEAYIEEVAGAPAVIVGNSMGGLLAEMVAANRPDLVQALVLIAPATPPVLPDPRLDWPNASRLLINATPGVGPAISRRLIQSMTPRELINESLLRITHNRARVPIDVVDSFVRLAETRRHFPWAADAVPKTGASIRRLFMRRRKFVAMVRRISAPTLVVQGISDPIVSPTSVEWLCSLRLDWELVQLGDTGHTPQIDAPIRLLAVVQPWLDTHQKHEMTA